MAQYWKQHVCVGCGTVFRYTYLWRVTPPRARPVASKRPCPTCGLYQPDMIGTPRLVWHLLIGGFGCLATVVLAGLGTGLTLPDRVAMWGAAGLGALVLVSHLIVLRWNPNRHPQANLRRAKELRRSGVMERVRGEAPDRAAPEAPRWGFGPAHGLALAGLAFANLMFVAADLACLVCDWPTNPGCRPAVVGPGDECRVYFDGSFASVKGLWRGEAVACALNFAELGLDAAPLEATTHNDTWGRMIYAQHDEMATRVSPWVAVQVPDSPRVAGQAVQLRADLVAQFPEWHGTRYDNEERTFTRTTALRVAARPGDGELYAGLWHGGGFAGAAVLGLMSLALAFAAWSLRRRAFPLKVVRDPDEDEEDRYDRPRRRRRLDD